jgi:hypothetical protein
VRRQHGDARAHEQSAFSTLTFFDGTGLLVRTTAGQLVMRPAGQEDRRDRRHEQRARAGRGAEGKVITATSCR